MTFTAATLPTSPVTEEQIAYKTLEVLNEIGQVLQDANDIAEGRSYVDVVITSAELLALNATPIELVPAPGANKYLEFCGAIVQKPAGTAYAAIAEGDDIAIKYTDDSGLDVGVCEATGFLDQTTAQVRHVLPQTGALAAGTVSDFTPAVNAALVAHMLTGEITTGDSDLNLRVFYKTHPSVF